MGNRPNHNGTLGTNGDDTYEQTNVEIVYMDSSRIGKDHKMHQNGKEKGYSVSTDKTKVCYSKNVHVDKRKHVGQPRHAC